jgi:CHAT domain-containing protein
LAITLLISFFDSKTAIGQETVEKSNRVSLAVAAYHKGELIEAIEILKRYLQTQKLPRDRATILRLTLEICGISFDNECLSNGSEKLVALILNDPYFKSNISEWKAFAPHAVYYQVLSKYRKGDMQGIKQIHGYGFAEKIFNPIADPVIYAKANILSSEIYRYLGNKIEARRSADRAFLGLLRINPKISAFDFSRIASQLIALAWSNGQLFDVISWLKILHPVIDSNLSNSAPDYALYLRTVASVWGIHNNRSSHIQALKNAVKAQENVKISPYAREYLLTTLDAELAIVHGLAGNISAAKSVLDRSIYSKKFQAILERGSFASMAEFYFGAAYIVVNIRIGEKSSQSVLELINIIRDTKYIGGLRGDLAKNFDIIRGFILLVAKFADRKDENFFKENVFLGEEIVELMADVFASNMSASPDVFVALSEIDKFVLNSLISLFSTGRIDPKFVFVASQMINRGPQSVGSDNMIAKSIFNYLTDSDNQQSALRLISQRSKWANETLRQFVHFASPNSEYKSSVVLNTATLNNKASTYRKYSDGILDALGNLSESKVGRWGGYIVDVESLQSSLRDNEVFIGAFNSFSSQVSYCVTRKGYAVRANKSYPNLINDVRIIRLSLTSQHPPSVDLDSQFPMVASHRLYKHYFGGIEECFQSKQHIIFSSPHELLGIPISVFVSSMPKRIENGYDLAKAEWLGKKFSVSYNSSPAGFMAARKIGKFKRPSGGFLGVGAPRLKNSIGESIGKSIQLVLRGTSSVSGEISELEELPETEKELITIGKIWAHSSKAKILVRDEATEERFRLEQIDQYEVIHFATHGLIRGDLPGLKEAAVVLTPSENGDQFDDGLLTATEIANLTLRAKMVILSACNTANFDGAQMAGHIQGLTVAFGVAGVPAVVASLWPVDSLSSQLLMTSLHRELKRDESQSVAHSMRASIQNMFKNPPSKAYLHPRFWAPFVIYGDGAVDLSPSSEMPDLEFDFRSHISKLGGEVVDSVPFKNDFITSEYDEYDGNSYKAILKRVSSEGEVKWRLRTGNVGVENIAANKSTIFVSGVAVEGQEGRRFNKLRAFDPTGRPLWQTDFGWKTKGRFIFDMAAEENGVWLLVGPVSTAPSKLIDYTLVLVDNSGEIIHLSRIDIEGDVKRRLVEGKRTLIRGKQSLVVAINDGRMLSSKSEVDRYGLRDSCYSKGGVSVHIFDIRSRKFLASKYLPGGAVSSVLKENEILYLAGQAHYDCRFGGKAAVVQYNIEKQTVGSWTSRKGFFTEAKFVWREKGELFASFLAEKKLSVKGASLLQDKTFSSSKVKKKRSGWAEYNGDVVYIVRLDQKYGITTVNRISAGFPILIKGGVKSNTGVILYGSLGMNPWRAHRTIQ